MGRTDELTEGQCDYYMPPKVPLGGIKMVLIQQTCHPAHLSLTNHHHFFVTLFSYEGNTVFHGEISLNTLKAQNEIK